MKGVPVEALEIVMSSISASTFKQYDSALKQWSAYCSDQGCNYFTPTRSTVLKFLTSKFNNGASYGTLNTLRSAISLLSQEKIGEDPMICKFLRGVYKSRPTKPKYTHTWDVSTVLEYLKTIDINNSSTSFKQLTEKTLMLIALVTAHRAQTFASIEISNIKFTNTGAEILITKLIKTSAPNRPQPVLQLPFFVDSPQLCVASTLRKYLSVTKDKRKDNKELFVSLRDPEKSVGSQTISRWLKNVLRDSGIDTSIFSGHSVRHAATSSASNKGIDIDTIRTTANWTANSQVFAMFYNRPILSKNSFAIIRN